ncbi:MAG: Smr/MutS family protein [Spirochaetia bacterium]|nr:Smr/MutS family protein [Spirochaetia bacterium]
MRFEEAKNKFLQEIEHCFARGIEFVEVIHGIGTYTLRNMVLNEINNIEYIELFNPLEYSMNPGSLKLVIKTPDKYTLYKYIERE